MKVAQGVCAIAVELSLLLLVVLAILAPLHARFTTHLPLVQSIDGTHAMIAGDVSTLTVGESLPLYRFNYSWKTPIGTGYVDSVEGARAVIHVDPSAMHAELARNGEVYRKDGKTYAKVGSALGFQEGDTLTIFRDSERMGGAHIRKLGAESSEIALAKSIDGVDGLVASAYLVPTEATLFDNALVASIEILLIVGSFALYVVLYIVKRRSPFFVFGDWLRSLPIPQRLVFWIINILAGVPFVWFMGIMPLRLAAYLLHFLPLKHAISFDPYIPYAWGIVAILYYAYLLWRRRSPLLAFWRAISYTRVGAIKTVSWKRGLLMWALHLIIVYVFARTLVGFFISDIAAAQAIGQPQSAEDFFMIAKYLIWALTVAGCLLGYGYSVLSILWLKFIRNLDFTVVGWLTNAFCYPLLGVVIWHMVPSFTGSTPIITDGPAFYLMLGVGFMLNLLYMLSIWNLGTMFDLMADKGVRTSLFYSVIRHPNYMLEACMFFATELVGLSTGTEWLVIPMFFFLYWIRSEREDNFMNYSNPDYEPYTRQTPYKFIPGIY